MRRHLAPLAALAVLALAGGCSGGGADSAVWETPKASSSAPSSAPSGVTLSADARATCDKAAKIGNAFGGTFMTDLRLRIDAEAKGASARSAAQTKMDRHLNEYSSALAGLARSTGDAALKKALKQMSTQVKALKGDFRKLNAQKLSATTASLDEACGRS
jgi:hypothetical protein